MRKRWFDPLTGRWLERDPAGAVDGPNLYQHVRGQPTHLVDPMGLRADGVWEAVSNFLGLASGGRPNTGENTVSSEVSRVQAVAQVENTPLMQRTAEIGVQGQQAVDAVGGPVPASIIGAGLLASPFALPAALLAVEDGLLASGTVAVVSSICSAAEQGAEELDGLDGLDGLFTSDGPTPLPNASDAPSIQTPYALESQNPTPWAQGAAEQADGVTLYRSGQLGKSMAGESQYWSFQNPMSPNYNSTIGMPDVTPDFVMGGTLRQGESLVVNEAAGIGSNGGGALQVVTSPGVAGLGAVRLEWFVMP